MKHNLVITDRKIHKVSVINQSIDHLWWLWTTHEGLKKLFGADNKIELEPFGAFEIYFNEDEPSGNQGSESCQILSYLPGEMLSFTWNAPPYNTVVRNHAYKTWVVVKFKEVNNGYTAVTLTHLGWPAGEPWDEALHYFGKAWGTVMKRMETVNADTVDPSSFFIKDQNGKVIAIT